MDNSRLKNAIYKFLDDYFGTEIYVLKTPAASFSFSASTSFNVRQEFKYQVCFKKGGPVFTIYDIHKGMNQISILNEAEVLQDIHSIFKLNYEKSSQYVYSWFGNRQNIKKISDLEKIVSLAK